MTTVRSRASPPRVPELAKRKYDEDVKTVWQGRIGQAAAKYGEHAPMATTCCNACRTCVQTNLVAGVLAATIAAGAGLARFGGRLLGRPSAAR